MIVGKLGRPVNYLLIVKTQPKPRLLLAAAAAAAAAAAEPLKKRPCVGRWQSAAAVGKCVAR